MNLKINTGNKVKKVHEVFFDFNYVQLFQAEMRTNANIIILSLECRIFFFFLRKRRGGRGRVPETSEREIFADLPEKEGQWKNGAEKKEKSIKGNKMRRRPFFFFFFCFSLFKPLKFVLGLPGKTFKEKWLCPLWKIFFLRPWQYHAFSLKHQGWIVV